MKTTLTHIHFIVNPIAGTGKNEINRDLLHQFFDPEAFNITIKYSEYRKHSTTLTMESIKEGANIIVACGGDGTINEVASCLVNSKIALGIEITTGWPVCLTRAVLRANSAVAASTRSLVSREP
jgi:diacylglycerol kinase family enzyme